MWEYDSKTLCLSWLCPFETNKFLIKWLQLLLCLIKIWKRKKCFFFDFKTYDRTFEGLKRSYWNGQSARVLWLFRKIFTSNVYLLSILEYFGKRRVRFTLPIVNETILIKVVLKSRIPLEFETHLNIVLYSIFFIA